MLSDTPVKKHATTIDTFCALLAGKLQYQPGERDCAIMQAKARLMWLLFCAALNRPVPREHHAA